MAQFGAGGEIAMASLETERQLIVVYLFQCLDYQMLSLLLLVFTIQLHSRPMALSGVGGITIPDSWETEPGQTALHLFRHRD